MYTYKPQNDGLDNRMLKSPQVAKPNVFCLCSPWGLEPSSNDSF